MDYCPAHPGLFPLSQLTEPLHLHRWFFHHLLTSTVVQDPTSLSLVHEILKGIETLAACFIPFEECPCILGGPLFLSHYDTVTIACQRWTIFSECSFLLKAVLLYQYNFSVLLQCQSNAEKCWEDWSTLSYVLKNRNTSECRCHGRWAGRVSWMGMWEVPFLHTNDCLCSWLPGVIYQWFGKLWWRDLCTYCRWGGKQVRPISLWSWSRDWQGKIRSHPCAILRRKVWLENPCLGFPSIICFPEEVCQS